MFINKDVYGNYEVESNSGFDVMSVILGVLIEGVIILSCNLWFGNKLPVWYGNEVSGTNILGQTIKCLLYGTVAGIGIYVIYKYVIGWLFENLGLSNTYKNLGVLFTLFAGLILFRIQTGVATLPLLAYSFCMLIATHYGAINDESYWIMKRLFSNKTLLSTIAILGYLGFFFLRALDGDQTDGQVLSVVGVTFMYSLILLIFESIYDSHIDLIYLGVTFLFLTLCAKFYYHETIFMSIVWGIFLTIPNVQIVYKILILRIMAEPTRTYYTDSFGNEGHIDSYTLHDGYTFGTIHHTNGSTTDFNISSQIKNGFRKIHFR